MRFGINFFPSVGPDEKAAPQFYDESLDLCSLADGLGYSSIKIVEHYFFAYGGYSPDPVTFLTAAAQRTERIRLITGAVIPAFTHPLKLAGKLAMLDNLSHGRLDVGFARAFLPDEFEAFQVSMEESRARFGEGVEATRRLWCEEKLTWDGEYYQFGPVTMLPRPYQQPHPPIWIAAVSTQESFEWAGRHGYNLMIVPYISSLETIQELLGVYRQAWADGGHAPGQEQIQAGYHLYVADDGDEARLRAKGFYEDYTTKLLHAVSAWDRTKSSEYKGYDQMANKVRQSSFEKVLAETKVFAGNPDEVAEQVQQVREWFGEIEPSLQVSFGNMPVSESRRSMELFARDVMPRFATAAASS